MKQLETALKKAGAEKLKDGYYFINGWRVRFNTRGVYWHNKLSEDFKIAFDGLKYDEKGGKPFTSSKDLKKAVIVDFVSRLTTNKTRAVIRRESREKAKKERAERRRLEKRIWCKGCPFSPNPDSKKCDNMKWSEANSIFYCKDKRFYEWYWCENAKRVNTVKREPWVGNFVCKVTNKPCPYEVPMITKGAHALGRNASGEHYTECPHYKKETT